MSPIPTLLRPLAVLLITAGMAVSTHAQTRPAAKTPPATGQTNAQVLARVNGERLPVTHADLLLRERLAQGLPNSPELRTAVRETLINQAVMAQEAKKLGLDRQPLVAAQMELARQNVLVQAWQQTVAPQIQVEEADLTAEYERQIQGLGDTEFLLRHVLLAEEDTAKLLLAKVQSGARLADLTSEYSRDVQTKDKGGLSEWTPVGQLVPTIREALQGLGKSEVVPRPVQSPVGWHVLQLEDQRAYQPPPMEQVRPQLTQAVIQQKLQARIAELRQAAKVE
jgi:peptidyl-prolyl cis-trans isomerase C